MQFLIFQGSIDRSERSAPWHRKDLVRSKDLGEGAPWTTEQDGGSPVPSPPSRRLFVSLTTISIHLARGKFLGPGREKEDAPNSRHAFAEPSCLAAWLFRPGQAGNCHWHTIHMEKKPIKFCRKTSSDSTEKFLN